MVGDGEAPWGVWEPVAVADEVEFQVDSCDGGVADGYCGEEELCCVVQPAVVSHVLCYDQQTLVFRPVVVL